MSHRLIAGFAIAMATLSTSAFADPLKVTFYGFPDNTPPSAQIAYPAIHVQAGGTGKFDDPITAAVKTPQNGGDLSPGTRLYAPFLQKYLIVEDECAGCVPQQVDIWLESNASSDADQVLACEDASTPAEPQEIQLNPPPGLPVSPSPLFEVNTNTCNAPAR